MSQEDCQAVTIYESAPPPMSVQDVRHQVNTIQEIMKSVMKDGEHFGKIPGCGDKPALLKPGAEKLNLTFRMAPRYKITRSDMLNNHREYEIVCSLYAIGSEAFLADGVGSCSTMESKYRYRNVEDYELTGQPIPKDSKEKKTEYRKKGFGMKKVDGVWEWVKYKDSSKQENPDIADTYNTVLKMAKKRALVDAVLTATAASDIFTQDIEDMAENGSFGPQAKQAVQAKNQLPEDDFIDFPFSPSRVDQMIFNLTNAGKLKAAEKFLNKISSQWTDADIDKIEVAKKKNGKPAPEASESPTTHDLPQTNSKAMVDSGGMITDEQIDALDGLISSKHIRILDFIDKDMTKLTAIEAAELILTLAAL